MKILMGCDGSDNTLVALDDLPKAGLPRVADLRVISVHEIWGLAVFEDESDITRIDDVGIERTRETARQAGRRIQSLFPDWNITSEAYAGSPARVIIEHADAWQADLIIICAPARTGYLHGSVSSQIVTEAHCSVRVSRHCGKRDHPPRIIIGLDGSPQSEAAVRAVASRNWPPGAEVKLITSLVRAALLPDRHPWPEWYKAREIHLDMQRELEAAGLTVSTAIEEGDPKRILIEEAAKWEADSIFVGATSLHRIARFLLGSVPTSLLIGAGCSIEVTRTAEPGAGTNINHRL